VGQGSIPADRVGVLRVVASIAIVVVLYYLLPFDRSYAGVVVAILAIGLVVFIGLVAFQVRSVIFSPFPGLRAIEALATSVPLFLALFASTCSSWPGSPPAASAPR
jgi:hypothetical protein